MKQFFIVGILAFACLLAKAQNNFEVSGQFLKSTDGAKVQFSYTDAEGQKVQGGVLVENGRFSIRGNIKFPEKVYIWMFPAKKDEGSRNSRDNQEFYLEKGKTTITGTDKISEAEITGGKTQTESQMLSVELGILPGRMEELIEKFKLAMAAKDSAVMKQISAEAKPLYAKIDSIQNAFIYKHPGSFVSLDLLSQKTQAIDLETFLPYYNALTEEVLSSPLGKKVTAKLKLAQKTAPGNTFDFTQPDTDGNPFILSSLQGKYVFVDFWASWCKPCRAENPNLVKAYKKYRNKNFEIVSISLDENKKAWLYAVEKDGLNWIHVSDLKGFKNEVAKEYGITAVPQNVLLDPNGVIIAKNLRGEELEKKLASVFK